MNAHNLYYEITIRRISDETLILVPIQHSTYHDDSSPVIFGAGPAWVNEVKALDTLIADINKYMKSHDTNVIPITRHTDILDSDGACIGFISEGITPLNFFHAPIAPRTDASRSILHPYSVADIDASIDRYIHASHEVELSPEAAMADVHNRLYTLFLAEFSMVVRSKKNQVIRKKLCKLISVTVFQNTESVTDLRRKIMQIIAQFPCDIKQIRHIISVEYAMNNDDQLCARIIASIQETQFLFDQELLAELQAETSHENTKIKLKQAMANNIAVVDTLPASYRTSNMYTSCTTNDVRHGMCQDDKLIVPAEREDEMYDILASDIRNAHNTDMVSMVSSGVFNPVEFIRRPGEQLKIAINN